MVDGEYLLLDDDGVGGEKAGRSINKTGGEHDGE